MTRKYLKKLCLSAFVSLSVGLSGFFALTSNAQVYANTIPDNYEVEITELVNGDQADTNLCWDYASTKVLESYYYSNTESHEVINISEDWISLAYMYYVNDPNQTLVTDSPYSNINDKTSYVYGNTGVPQFYERVINAYGFVEEDDWQLNSAVTTENYKTLFEESLQFAQNSVFKDLEFSWIGNKFNDSTYSLENIVAEMKNMLYQNQMLYFAISLLFYETNGQDNYIYYSNLNQEPGHAMTIVGYDDNFSFTQNGQTITGAFKALNSSSTNRYFYVPYAMFAPQIEDNTEKNLILSNTFHIKNVSITVPSEDEGGNQEEPTDPVVPPADDPSTEPSLPPVEPDEPTTETPNFMDIFNQKQIAEKVVVLFGVGIGVIFTITAIVLLSNAIIRKTRTNSLNQKVLAKTLSQYQSHQFELQKQKQDLEDEIKALREEASRRKQRRLKRNFYKNIKK